jgi:hypothetical protein
VYGASTVSRNLSSGTSYVVRIVVCGLVMREYGSCGRTSVFRPQTCPVFVLMGVLAVFDDRIRPGIRRVNS